MSRRKVLHQLQILNLNYYIDTSNDIYIRLNHARSIMKFDDRNALIRVQRYLKNVHFVIFEYFTEHADSF